MKKLTYILLFIWNIGIGQEGNNSGLNLIDSIKTVWVNEVEDTSLFIGDVIYSKEVEGLGTEFSPFKYDTVKAVLMACDSLDEVDTKFLRSGEQVVIGTRSYGNTYFYWIYGYVINSIDYVYTSCNGHEAGIMCERPHYKPIRTPRGYLTLDKKPFSKEIIIWDYKIIE